MVPDAEFSSYYGRPILKSPTWKVPDVPLYLYLGGAAGTSACIAALADVTGRGPLRRWGRLAALTGALVSVGALVHDLGRPRRFLHMLRVLKPTSPLSVGSWILAPFGALSGLAAASELTGIAPAVGPRGRGRRRGARARAWPPTPRSCSPTRPCPPGTTAHRELPFVFAGSALAAGGGIGLAAGGDVRPARRVAVAGAALELTATAVLERRVGFARTAYTGGRAGRLLTLARAATAPGRPPPRPAAWCPGGVVGCSPSRPPRCSTAARPPPGSGSSTRAW